MNEKITLTERKLKQFAYTAYDYGKNDAFKSDITLFIENEIQRFKKEQTAHKLRRIKGNRHK